MDTRRRVRRDHDASREFRGSEHANRDEARLLQGDEEGAAAKLIDSKYPILQGVLVHLAHRIRRLRTVHYELTFEQE